MDVEVTEDNVPAARIMRMLWNTDHGQVDFSFPSNLSEQDVEDIDDLLALALNGMRRRAQTIRALKPSTDPAKEGGDE